MQQLVDYSFTFVCLSLKKSIVGTRMFTLPKKGVHFLEKAFTENKKKIE